MAADLRIGRRQDGQDCGKLGLPEITLGVLPGAGFSHYVLPESACGPVEPLTPGLGVGYRAARLTT